MQNQGCRDTYPYYNILRGQPRCGYTGNALRRVFKQELVSATKNPYICTDSFGRHQNFRRPASRQQPRAAADMDGPRYKRTHSDNDRKRALQLLHTDYGLVGTPFEPQLWRNQRAAVHHYTAPTDSAVYDNHGVGMPHGERQGEGGPADIHRPDTRRMRGRNCRHTDRSVERRREMTRARVHIIYSADGRWLALTAFFSGRRQSNVALPFFFQHLFLNFAVVNR